MRRDETAKRSFDDSISARDDDEDDDGRRPAGRRGNNAAAREVTGAGGRSGRDPSRGLLPRTVRQPPSVLSVSFIARRGAPAAGLPIIKTRREIRPSLITSS